MVRIRLYDNSILRSVVAMLICIAATCLFSACEKKHHKKQPVLVVDESLADSRTVLLYMVADNNNLERFVAEDVNELIQGVKNAHLKKGDKIVVYVDDSGLPRLFTLDAYSDVESYLDLVPSYSYSSEVNSASGEQLAEVLRYTKENYPASSYGIVLWSHGTGWIPPETASAKRRKSFAADYGNREEHEMSVPELADAIQKNGGVDFVFFDACFMQTIEIDYALRKCTDFVIGSPAEIPGPGADYSTIVSSMFKADDCVGNIVQAYYEEYQNNDDYGVIISAVDTRQLDHFASYMRTVISNNVDSLLSNDYDKTLNYFNCKDYPRAGFPDFFDMQGVMLGALTHEDFIEWKEEFSKIVVNNLYTSWWFSAVMNNKNSPFREGTNHSVIAEQCGGVSMFVPLEDRYKGYNYIDWNRDTEWGAYVWQDCVK